jgi:heme oxygenase
MIGKKMSEVLLGGHTLRFYQWEGDVKVLLDNVRKDIDVLASTWSEDERQQCLDETAATFRYGGSLLSYISAPKQ